MFQTTPRSEGRILDFDIENRPLSYWYADACTAEVTAIAWSWVGEDRTFVHMLDPPPDHVTSLRDMLSTFVTAYDEAAMVTGHFIRRHDLPILNGALLEQGLPPLSAKMTSDTKIDLTRRGAIAASQEALAAMLDIPAPKIQMTQEDWREANRLTPAGLKLTAQRVSGDVLQHKLMRAELLRRGLLGTPRLWSP